jgi:alpha-beta hydrolase superfamily lysophospholipase
MPILTAKREQTENTMTTWDGTKLFYRAWLPASPTNKALILFHRGHEHSGRFQELVDSLDLEDAALRQKSTTWFARPGLKS